ncbi:MAG: efflux RND transporter periplasmic adaptor subunit [Acidobacteriia bacterium]|nr:efflux RND transporter periplasmic adaptor subunit [Terriglobia bacterium]
MRKIYLILAAGLLAACSQNPKAESAAPKAETPEPLKASVWTRGGELYLEYPALVRGQKQRFAIHLTRLTDFKAVKDAACEVHLGVEVFPCDPSTHPGIFGANVEPKTAGEAAMSIVVHGKDLNEAFDVGTVKVASDVASTEKPAEPKEETIAFSKEQQWALDFGTELAAEQSMRDNLRVAAETLPRTGGEAVVTAPAAGRLIVDKTFAVGTTIEIGTELANIVPPVGSTTDTASLQLAETEARVSLEQAQRDRARAERLLAAGAVPARRAEEARAVEATAQARLQAAQTRLQQFDSTRSGDGKDTGVKRFVVRAPISGILAESSAISGANTEVGKSLFRIVDINSIFVSGVVPESEFSKLRQLSGAEVEMPDGQIRPAGKLVAVGRLVDAETRTVPVTYETDNHDHRLAINQTVFLRLFLTPMGKAPVVPEAAIIDDAGRPVVFVQRGGETFLRRPVKLGIRNHGLVQVLEGVNVGDRVVTKGAYLIRLSTMSSAVPAHGHVH